MLQALRRHPLPMRTRFGHSLVLTYALPPAVLEPLLPPGLALDTYTGPTAPRTASSPSASCRPSACDPRRSRPASAWTRPHRLPDLREVPDPRREDHARAVHPAQRHPPGRARRRGEPAHQVSLPPGPGPAHPRRHRLTATVDSRDGGADLTVTADLGSRPAPLPPGSPFTRGPSRCRPAHRSRCPVGCRPAHRSRVAPSRCRPAHRSRVGPVARRPAHRSRRSSPQRGPTRSHSTHRSRGGRAAAVRLSVHAGFRAPGAWLAGRVAGRVVAGGFGGRLPVRADVAGFVGRGERAGFVVHGKRPAGLGAARPPPRHRTATPQIDLQWRHHPFTLRKRTRARRGGLLGRCRTPSIMRRRRARSSWSRRTAAPGRPSRSRSASAGARSWSAARSPGRAGPGAGVPRRRSRLRLAPRGPPRTRTRGGRWVRDR